MVTAIKRQFCCNEQWSTSVVFSRGSAAPRGSASAVQVFRKCIQILDGSSELVS